MKKGKRLPQKHPRGGGGEKQKCFIFRQIQEGFEVAANENLFLSSFTPPSVYYNYYVMKVSGD